MKDIYVNCIMHLVAVAYNIQAAPVKVYLLKVMDPTSLELFQSIKFFWNSRLVSPGRAVYNFTLNVYSNFSLIASL